MIERGEIKEKKTEKRINMYVTQEYKSHHVMWALGWRKVVQDIAFITHCPRLHVVRMITVEAFQFDLSFRRIILNNQCVLLSFNEVY